MLQFLEIDAASAKKQAARVLALETKMAESRLDRVARRDRRNTYNPMSLRDLQKLTPSINWNNIFQHVINIFNCLTYF